MAFEREMSTPRLSSIRSTTASLQGTLLDCFLDLQNLRDLCKFGEFCRRVKEMEEAYTSMFCTWTQFEPLTPVNFGPARPICRPLRASSWLRLCFEHFTRVGQ